MRKGSAIVCVIALGTTLGFASAFAAKVDSHSSALPSVVQAVAPVFPVPVNGPNAFGSVVVEVKINSRGVVTVAHAVQGHPVLYKAAESASQCWLFAPASEGAKLRVVRLTFLFKFMDEGTPDEDLLAIFMPPYQIEVRRIWPMIKTQISDSTNSS